MTQDESIEFFAGSSYKIKPAPFFKRFLAACIDFGIIASVQHIALMIIASMGILAAVVVPAYLKYLKFSGVWNGISSGISNRLLIFLLILFVALLVYVLVFGIMHFYFIYYEYKKQTTIGKRIFGLSVVSLDGKPVTLRQCLIREVMRMLEGALILPALISMLVTKNRQRLGDLMAGTVVVHSASEEKEHDLLYLSGSEFTRYQQLWGAPKLLTEADAEDFLAFSYPHYIYPISYPGVERINYHISKARSFYELPEDITLAGQEEQFIRYHAEQCLKVVRQS